MESIEVRYSPIQGVPGTYHKYLIYTDSMGIEHIGRGGPTGASGTLGTSYALSGPNLGTSEYGKIGTFSGYYNEFSYDWNPDYTGPHDTITTGEDLSDYWDAITDALDDIEDEGYKYWPRDQNSNSVIDEALDRAGLPRPQLDDPGEYWAPGSDHPLNGAAKIWDDITSGNIAKYWDSINALWKIAETIVERRDPLLLDLNGDGLIATTTADNGQYFDMDKNGFAEKTAWVGSGDGFLVRDINANGQIDDGGELFGDRTLINNGNSYATNGFQALADLDSNLDGIINSSDTHFSDLKILTSNGELLTLAEAGIQSISLSATSSGQQDSSDNTIQFIGQYTKTNNTIGTINSYLLQKNSEDTIFKNLIPVSSNIWELPYIVGEGNVMDLHQAMAHDTSGDLQDLIEAFITETDLAVRNSLVDQILAQWTNTVGVTAGSRGTYVDAQQLAILEAFEGRYMDGSATSQITIQAKGLTIEATYDNLHNLVFAQLEAQTHLKELMDDLVLTNVNGQNIVSLDGQEQTILDVINTNVTTGKELLGDFVRVIKTFNLHLTSNYSDFYTTFAALGSDYEWILNSVNMNEILGTSSADTLNGTQFADAFRGGNDDDSIVGWEGNDFIMGEDGNDSLQGCVGDDTILGGDGNDTILGIYDRDSLVGGAGNDTLDGGTENDTLEGGLGNDSLVGGSGDDTYVFNLGDDQDVITDAFGANNTIRFGAGITVDDLRFSGSSVDLTIYNDTTGDSISVPWQLAYQSAGGIVSQQPVITSFIFDDGTVLIAADVASMLENRGTSNADSLTATYFNDKVYGLAGDDTLHGQNGNDTIDGGEGNDLLYGDGNNDSIFGGAGDDTLIGNTENDTLSGGTGTDSMDGGTGNDTYIYNTGDGQDTVNEVSGGGTDTLKLNDLLQNQVTFVQAGWDVDVLINGTSDKVRIKNIFNPGLSDFPVEKVEFSDGSFVTRDQILEGLLEVQGTSSADSLAGSGLNEKLSGYAGNDTINGNAGNDTLIGGIGNDSLDGNLGDDTYVFNIGDGQDTITDNYGTADKIKFGPGITPDDVIFSGSSVDLKIYIDGTNDWISVPGQFNYQSAGGVITPLPVIESFVFENGTILTVADVAARLEVRGTSGADALDGTYLGEKIFGYDGNDTLYGYNGNDSLNGGSGNDTLYGDAGNDVLNGDEGNDTLYGSIGDDRYLFGQGDGQDIIDETQFSDGNDTLKLTDLNLNDVMFKANGWDLDILVNGTTDKITLKQFFYPASARWIETVEFADNTSVTMEQITNELLEVRGTTTADTLYGSDLNEKILGLAGNDTLAGGGGSDTYVFNLGDGQDTINETSGTADKVKFGAGITANDVVFSVQNSYDLAVSINGTSDSLLLTNLMVSTTNQYDVESFEFSNGTVLSKADIIASRLEKRGTSGTDYITGSQWGEKLSGYDGNDELWADNGNDTLDGGTGNDFLAGGNGNDLLLGGDGNDSLHGSYGADTLNGGSGNDVFDSGADDDLYVFDNAWGLDSIVEYTGNDTLNFSTVTSNLTINLVSSGGNEVTDGTNTVNWNFDDIENAIGGSGNDSITGNAVANIFKGNAGTDTLQGGAGNDVYQFAKGHGQDLVIENDATVGNSDKLLFDNSVGQSVVAIFKTVSGDLQIGYTDSSGDLVTIQGFDTSAGRIERLELSNGNYLTDANINQIIADMSAYAATNSISFNSLNDVKNDAGLLAIVNGSWHS